MIANEVLIRRRDVVRVHLDILEEVLSKREPGVPEAIRASMSLRFLFDNTLGRVASEAASALHIPAPSLDRVPLDQAMAAAAGGYVLGGRAFAPYYLYREPGISSPHRPQYEEQVRRSPKEHALEPVSLGRFKRLPCLALLGRTFTREATVRYVANKCGGAHHDDDPNVFNEIEHGLTNVGHSLQLDGHGVSAVFLETLGTAWFIMTAPDIKELRARLGS